MTKQCIAAITLLLIGYQAFCQNTTPEVNDNTPAIANARALFLQYINADKEIYTGPEHIGYQPTIEGFAYFLSKEWQAGSLQYDGFVYSSELLLYDMVKDQLIVQRPDGFAIELRNDKVDWFSMPGHLFVHIRNAKGLKPGFYEQLASGKLTVLARRVKLFDEKLQDNGARQKFNERTTYYAGQDNSYQSIRNLKALLRLTGHQGNTVQQQLKKQGIRYKKNPDAALAAAARFYNQIQP